MKIRKASIAAVILALALCLTSTAYAAKPISVSNTDFIPLREVCNTLGIDVAWDGQTRTITLNDYGITVNLKFSGDSALINSHDNSSIPVTVINNKTYVPLEAANKLLGVSLKWDSATQSYDVLNWGIIPQTASSITITSAAVTGDNLVVSGKSTIDTSKSTYIQYYIGKEYDGTISECIKCDGFKASSDGTFSASIPTSGLKGAGNYQIVLEQNPNSDTILTQNHWTAFTKDTSGNVTFGDITSMCEISNLAKTVGMQIAAADFTVAGTPAANNAITITNTTVGSDNITVTGKTTIDTSKSTYIQYYVGKVYDGTLSECIKCDGFKANSDGTFSASIPVSGLKGAGDYTLVLEQNPNADTILAPSHWVAFTKDTSGTVTFGDITSMGEISNLALTVGMQTATTSFTVGTAAPVTSPITITSAANVNGDIVIKGTTTIDPAKSTYIQYYVGKEYANTLSNCIVCDGIKATADGTFTLTVPNASLKGNGVYTVVLEQNPNANTILGPENWKAFYKDANGNTVFGSIAAMKEISNLALTVGMKTADATVVVTK